jgi:hypothetical protein
MKLLAGADVDKFVEMRFKPDSWERNGIPTEGCRIRAEAFEHLAAEGGRYDVHELIHGLMDWLDVTDDPHATLKTLRIILNRHFPCDGRSSAKCHFQDEAGVDQIFHVGPVATRGHVVSWQRAGWVIAVAQPREDGRITVGAPRPISLSVARSILNHSMVNFMHQRFDSFEGLRATSRRTANFYSWQKGAATVLDWEHGLGQTGEDDASTLTLDQSMPIPTWLPSNQLAAMIAIGGGNLD